MLLVLLVLAGCQGLMSVADRRLVAHDIAVDAGLTGQQIQVGRFVLQTYHRGLEIDSDVLVVYIEGDGHPWQSRYRLSDDPTPVDPVALQLAVRDPARSVLYIARPCQYVSAAPANSCDSKYWSSHRYGEVVVDAIDQVIDSVLATGSSSKIMLVGYSGGGSLAALIAARRADVTALMTVAANLDHALWTRQGHISPLNGSLNAADIAHRISAIPQVHYTGAKDRNVDARIVDSFLSRMSAQSVARRVTIPGFDHHCCWDREWQDLRCPPQTEFPACVQ